ncbi:hypothetical protein KIV56_11595 [Cryobacterium breve]|uniref:Type I restriction modification DNA specificity domain-containing protein n=1 Tax=Cryobacterium breve TaxID=1259258 RepID=A0ABY7NA10_9MICO|nr:hypothetical protein [Cryobacterium breve]WBM79134.1 hypothetical protein KIV56_11595 [Cryobacterium breve]
MESVTGGIQAIQQGDITISGRFDSTGNLRVDPATGTSQHHVRHGDVLLRSRGNSVAAWAVAGPLQETALAVSPLYVLRPTAGVLDPGYLAWMLMRPTAQSHFARESVGSNLKMIRRSAIETLPIELPPLVIQRAIASAALLAAREFELSTRLAILHNDLTALRLDACAPSNHHNDRNLE